MAEKHRKQSIVSLKHIAFCVTMRCTLKCKLCSVLTPYMDRPHFDFSALRANMDTFFAIADTVEYMNITGGEPLLQSLKGSDGCCGTGGESTLARVIKYLVELPADKPEKIRIYTSGTVVPDDEFCGVLVEAAEKKQFNFEIDNYGEHSVKLGELKAQLERFGLKYNVRDYSENLYYDGWVDFRHSFELRRGLAEARELMKKCACGNVHDVGFIGDVLVACPATYVRYVGGQIDKSHDEIIDLTVDIGKMREKYFRLMECDTLESCMYCKDGICRDSERFRPAEQVTAQEIEDFRKMHEMRF